MIRILRGLRVFRWVLPQSEHFLLGKGGIHPLDVSIETPRPAKLEPHLHGVPRA
jgi:hypothetical protein